MIILNKIYSYIFSLFIVSFLSGSISYAQEIDFSNYSSLYTMSISELNMSENLSFGTLIQNEGLVTVDIANAKVLTIEGVRYLDAYIMIIGDRQLLLDGNLACVDDIDCSIDLNLRAAYSNRGENNINQAVELILDANNFAVSQIPIKARGIGPPAPPPTPTYEGYNPTQYLETAYLYLFGDITVGALTAGTYTANITVNISYD